MSPKTRSFPPLCFQLVACVCVSFLDAYFIYLLGFSLSLSLSVWTFLWTRCQIDFGFYWAQGQIWDTSAYLPTFSVKLSFMRISLYSLYIQTPHTYTYIFVYFSLFLFSSSSSGSMNGLLQCVCTRLVLSEMRKNISKMDKKKETSEVMLSLQGTMTRRESREVWRVTQWEDAVACPLNARQRLHRCFQRRKPHGCQAKNIDQWERWICLVMLFGYRVSNPSGLTINIPLSKPFSKVSFVIGRVLVFLMNWRHGSSSADHPERWRIDQHVNDGCSKVIISIDLW